VPNQAKFFARLGERIRTLRKAQGFSQEDMISFGFSARHWQQIEAGRPITVTTLLRICEAFRVPVTRLLQGLDKGIY
jgi:transcriptional regulator with XRE-family HTH domain